jgi:carbamoyl-phosphate synthase large subunit
MTPVMVAGIGGASLGTELLKTLRLAGRYRVYGCDISPTAFGLYESGFETTHLVDRDDYVHSVISVCQASGARFVLPGGEQPMALLGAAVEDLRRAGITLVGNSARVIGLCSDKASTFEELGRIGVLTPVTAPLDSPDAIERVGLPCIVKPATGSGGSAAVFYATSAEEALMYAAFMRNSGMQPLAQEYVDADAGEFTIGVLSLPDGRVVSSVALRRSFDAKLSVAYRGRGGIVSSGYSQGYIDEFPDLCEQAERIAVAIGSTGPINVQCRLREGRLLPFEINPRFSASTYLRALAGVNEPDIFLQYLSRGEVAPRPKVRRGWYLRSLDERFVQPEAVARWSTG